MSATGRNMSIAQARNEIVDAALRMLQAERVNEAHEYSPGALRGATGIVLDSAARNLVRALDEENN